MKLYVLVDPNLYQAQRAVQAAHAVAEYMKLHPDTKWDNGTLVLLKAKNIEEEAKTADAIFTEPYWDNRITAVAKLGKDLYPNYKLL